MLDKNNEPCYTIVTEGKDTLQTGKGTKMKKWAAYEIDRDGTEHRMAITYNRREDAEYDRRIFLWENPGKVCVIREVEGE